MTETASPMRRLLRAAKQTTLARVFTADKLVTTKLFNALGLQVGRTLLARAVYACRPRYADRQLVEEMAALRSEGCVVIPNFLSPESFATVREEFQALNADPDVPRRVHVHGDTRVQHTRCLDVAARCPEIMRFMTNPTLQALLQSGERRRIDMPSGTQLIEHVRVGEGALTDPETTLHLDTFFHTHKAWLYLTDVSEDDGPLVFVKGSHRLGWRRLLHDWRNSLGQGGSRRITKDEAERVEETLFAVPANTLVIANTVGFHRRFPGKPGCTREALLMSVRFNPFTP